MAILLLSSEQKGQNDDLPLRLSSVVRLRLQPPAELEIPNLTSPRINICLRFLGILAPI